MIDHRGAVNTLEDICNVSLSARKIASSRCLPSASISPCSTSSAPWVRARRSSCRRRAAVRDPQAWAGDAGRTPAHCLELGARLARVVGRIRGQPAWPAARFAAPVHALRRLDRRHPARAYAGVAAARAPGEPGRCDGSLDLVDRLPDRRRAAAVDEHSLWPCIARPARRGTGRRLPAAPRVGDGPPLHRWHRPRERLLGRPGPHGREFREASAHGRAAVSHGRPGSPAAGRQHRVPRSRGFPGQGAGLPHRTRRDRGRARATPRRARVRRARHGRANRRQATRRLRRATNRRGRGRDRAAPLPGRAPASLHGAFGIRGTGDIAVVVERQGRPLGVAEG